MFLKALLLIGLFFVANYHFFSTTGFNRIRKSSGGKSYGLLARYTGHCYN